MNTCKREIRKGEIRMKLEEIYLSEGDTEKLRDLLESHNKDLPYQSKKTYQEYAEELLKDAIYYKWKTMISLN